MIPTTHWAKGRALDYYRRSIVLRDTLFGEAEDQGDGTLIEMDHEFAQRQLADSLNRAKKQVEEEMVHQAEVTGEREARNLALYGAIAVFLLAACSFPAACVSCAYPVPGSNASGVCFERLLLNPARHRGPGAEGQRQGHGARSPVCHHPLLRFQGLHPDQPDLMSAQALVEELDHCFKAFDRIVAAHE